MERRRFLSAASVIAASAAALRPARAADADVGIIDTNVYLSHWAVRHSWASTPAQLTARLRRHHVASAWTASFEGALHSDIGGVNARLAETCARDGGGLLVPVGTVNPTLPDWEDDLRRCHEVHRMKAVRLFPNYHGYTLDDPRFAACLEHAARRELLVQIPLSLEDDRSPNPVLAAPNVVPAPLPEVLAKIPQARVMLLNAGARVLVGNPALLTRLVEAGVWFDLATLEGVAGIEGVLQRAPAVQLTFGSHSPYFYFEAALLKLQESILTAGQLAAICQGHARAALGRQR